MTEIPNDIKKLSFEDAMSELEEIVDNLESGNIDLDKSIQYYTRGSHIRAHCQKKLDEAVMKLEEIQVSSEGKISKKTK
ncbi:exodeoxyribonuclease VII small subunit [Pelagibacteraceae bacterium]|nr:exodeoxyribonuclease VII small subunit [Pelagibacteraceae bacterium]